MKNYRKLLAGVLAGVMCLSLAACSSSSDSDSSASEETAEETSEEASEETAEETAGETEEESGGEEESAASSSSTTYHTLYSGEVNTLNYLITSTTNDMRVAANIVDCLVDYDEYGNIVPGLAESWETNDDMTEWTFHIREGVYWVDYEGNQMQEVTANDWVTTAQYVNDAANDSSNQYMYDTGAIVHNAQAYYDYTAYLIESEDGTLTTDADGNEIEVVEEVSADSIGVIAEDDYTLVYTLDEPCSFFLSILSYTSYLPVAQECLDEYGSSFALDNESMWYCGAYILTTYEPQEERVLTKNETYWDADNVYIEEVISTYNADASTVEAALYKNGEIDYASISSDLLDSWLEDEELSEEVHSSRVDNSYSYFFCFNFDPQFDEEYEPENWKIAVNNENFRKALMYALDRVKALTVSDPYNAEDLLNNTVTPVNFASAAGLDYTSYDALIEYTNGDSFDEDLAVEYRDLAKAELEEAGATFPIKVLMPYNPSTTNWDKECQVIEQQMEALLGEDFIDIIIEAGPETGFLSSVRRSGNYAFMKCNWGADYADPQTWAEPFADGNNYNFWYLSEDEETQAIFAEWSARVEEAAAIYDDDEARYAAFAEAEAILIEHAIIVPYSVDGGGYEASKLNSFEGEYAPYGMAQLRYKYMKVYDSSMSMDEYEEALAAWEEERAANLE